MGALRKSQIGTRMQPDSCTYGFKIVLFNRHRFVHSLIERPEHSLQHFSRRRFLRRSWRLILVVRRSFFKRSKGGQLPEAAPAKAIEQTRSGRLKAWLQCPLRVTGRLFWIGGELLLAALSHAIHCAFRQRGSEAEFITEHYWGYTAQRDGSTNPEELIAAAHASCFSMAFSAKLGKTGVTPESIHTTATVTLDKTDAGWTVTESHLDMTAKIPGLDQAKFNAIAKGAKAGCPISRLLKANVTLEAKLEG